MEMTTTMMTRRFPNSKPKGRMRMEKGWKEGRKKEKVLNQTRKTGEKIQHDRGHLDERFWRQKEKNSILGEKERKSGKYERKRVEKQNEGTERFS